MPDWTCAFYQQQRHGSRKIKPGGIRHFRQVSEYNLPTRHATSARFGPRQRRQIGHGGARGRHDPASCEANPAKRVLNLPRALRQAHHVAKRAKPWRRRRLQARVLPALPHCVAPSNQRAQVPNVSGAGVEPRYPECWTPRAGRHPLSHPAARVYLPGGRRARASQYNAAVRLWVTGPRGASMESYLAGRTAQTEAALAPPVNTRCAPLWHYTALSFCFRARPAARPRRLAGSRRTPLPAMCVCIAGLYLC